MNNLEKQMSPDLIALIKNDSAAGEALKKWIDSKRKHHANPVYVEAREAFNATQKSQIDKGADKYDEPLNPDSWTMDELGDHTIMELVDAFHYVTSLRVKARKASLKLIRAFNLMDSNDAGERRIARDVVREVINEL